MRIPLKERGANGEWTLFESRLYNLISHELPETFLFSKRLEATQLMLDALDSFVFVEQQIRDKEIRP